MELAWHHTVAMLGQERPDVGTVHGAGRLDTQQQAAEHHGAVGAAESSRSNLYSGSADISLPKPKKKAPMPVPYETGQGRLCPRKR
jgi:hypothetical protein